MTALPSEHPTAAGGGGAPQVLTFWLGSENYCIDVQRVQEIRGWSPVTRMPGLPPDFLGVLNLRGSVVPIVDLRTRFNLPQREFTPLTVVIVLSVETASGRRDFGLVADGVSDVVDIGAASLREPPSLGNQAIAGFIRGLVIVAGRMLILLNPDELCGRDSDSIAALESGA